MSPINQRRLTNFKNNKRGYWSLWIFLGFFIASLFAELIANDQPLMIKYQQSYYFPVFKEYLETDFGGEFESAADYKDPYITDLIEADGSIIWPPIRFQHQTINYDLPVSAPAPPSEVNWLGTDDQGRDVMAMIIYGFRLSVLFSIILTIASSFIGILAGAVQGFYGGKVDLFIQRFIEIWSGLPMLFLLIILASLIRPTFWWILGIMLLFSWTSLVDVVRAEFLRGRNLEYVRAARALGVSNFRIMYQHMLPNAMVATLTFMPFIFSSGVITLVSLDFLGFGLPQGEPSLGTLIAQGKDNLHAPWLGISIFVVLSTLLTLLIFIGEAVRDAFDPRKTLV